MTTAKTIEPPAAGRRVERLVSAALVPVPRGMSDGFYAFMGGIGSVRDATGQLLMLAERFSIPKRLALGESNYSSARLELEQFERSRPR